MNGRIRVALDLSADTPDSMQFDDTYAGLDGIWYRFSADRGGNVDLWATPAGFEHLARPFLKLARGAKSEGYHAHHALEFGGDQYAAGRELTIGVVSIPLDAT